MQLLNPSLNGDCLTPVLLLFSWTRSDGQFGTEPTVSRLAMEVKEAVESDPLSGPLSDRAKHFVGIEYEVALEHMLKERGGCQM